MIYLASDHAGYRLKIKVGEILMSLGHKFEDIGPDTLDMCDDYPDYIIPAAKKVSENPNGNKAIVMGYSGQGEAMAANRMNNVRALVFYGGPEKIIYLSRQHNNSNVLSLGARFINESSIEKIIDIWLNTPFSDKERHKRRIKKIEKFEGR